MASQKMVAIGTSAGGVDALIAISRELPADLAAPIFVVLHIPPDSPSLLPQILSRTGELPVRQPENGERWVNGTIYIAPPGLHMTAQDDGTISTLQGPRENRHRPAIDPLFRSVALAAGADAIAVVLTGSLNDGTAGALAIKQRGGTVIVQDPDGAAAPSMPRSVIEHVEVDAVVSLDAVVAAIVRAVSDGDPKPPAEAATGR